LGWLQTRTDDREVGAFRDEKIRIKLNVLFRKFEMQAAGIPSVDQLLVLLTVVEEGSFTGAAKRLRRATSAISYAIDTLEAQLGLTLFDRGTTRKPKLTHAGEAIVSEAKAVAHSVETLRARAQGLLEGLETEARSGPRPACSIGSAGWRRTRPRRCQPGVLAGW
jgi:molybdenum-dependent DNA-binding transcriptional regulator ModE